MTISTSQLRKAKEIANRSGHVTQVNVNTFNVYRQDTGTNAMVRRTRNGRFVSSGKWFQTTRREDTYIAAVKLTLGTQYVNTGNGRFVAMPTV